MINLKIAEGLEMLEIPLNMMGRESVIYPTLIWDDDNVVLVDAGGPNSLSELKKAMKKIDVPFEKLNKIIITHQDIDHIGGINEIRNELPDVEVLSHNDDKPYIQGEKRLVRLNSKFMERINAIPGDQREKVMDIFENTKAEVNTTLIDGDELPCCGGITVIHTPGHTPGHVCLYHKESKTIIAGDAMNIIDGQLTGPNMGLLTEKDAEEATNSLRKLANFDVNNVICYHGGLFNNNPNQTIKELF